MTRTVLFILALLISTPAFAQKHADDKNAVCKLLPKHTPANNVAYQPGVDVRGNAVVPADLNSAPVNNAVEVLKVPLNIDLAQRIAGLTGTGAQMEAPLGMLEIHQDGQIKYNGEDWTAPIMTLCGKSHKEVTVEIVEAPVEEIIEAPIEKPVAPIAPEPVKVETVTERFNEAAKETTQMPAVAAPKVEFLDEVTPTKERMKNMDRPKVSEPAQPIKPLIGTPKGAVKTIKSDIITGQDHRNYNE